MRDNEQIFDLLTELWNSGNLELVGDLYTDDAERTDPNQPEPVHGREQIGKYIAEVHAGFPDFKIKIDEKIGEGDRVASQWTCTGTHNGPFQGIPPTGKPVELHGVTVSRIHNGRFAEERVYFDRLALLQQLGVAPVEAISGAKTAGQR